MAIAILTPANPAAGAEISVTVPAGTYYVLKSLKFRLVTAIAVANRIVNLYLDDGVNVFFIDPNKTNQAASLTVDYVYAPGVNSGGVTPAGTDVLRQATIPSLVLGPSYRIRTVTTAIQAADQYSAIVALVDQETGEIKILNSNPIKLA